jgi:hypothetical protein
MSAALNFNHPTPQPVRLWREVAIGWEHDIADGEVVYRKDDAGNHIPKVYRIPGAVTGKDLIDRAQKLPRERLEALQRGDTPALFEISGMLVGDDVITEIGSDPTVPPAVFYEFLASLVEGLDTVEFTGAQDPKV